MITLCSIYYTNNQLKEIYCYLNIIVCLGHGAENVSDTSVPSVSCRYYQTFFINVLIVKFN